MGFDTTGSTPVLDQRSRYTPLALLPKFAENPNACSSSGGPYGRKEAMRSPAREEWGIDYTAYEGGIYLLRVGVGQDAPCVAGR